MPFEAKTRPRRRSASRGSPTRTRVQGSATAPHHLGRCGSPRPCCTARTRSDDVMPQPRDRIDVRSVPATPPPNSSPTSRASLMPRRPRRDRRVVGSDDARRRQAEDHASCSPGAEHAAVTATTPARRCARLTDWTLLRSLTGMASVYGTVGRDRPPAEEYSRRRPRHAAGSTPPPRAASRCERRQGNPREERHQAAGSSARREHARGTGAGARKTWHGATTPIPLRHHTTVDAR